MYFTKEQGRKNGHILVEERFFLSTEEFERYKRLMNIPGAAFKIEGYLRKKRWWEFW